MHPGPGTQLHSILLVSHHYLPATAESTGGLDAGARCLSSLTRTQPPGTGRLGWRRGHSGEGGPTGAELLWVLGVHLCWDVQAEAKCPFGRNRVHLWHTGLGRLRSNRKAEVHPTTCTQSQLVRTTPTTYACTYQHCVQHQISPVLGGRR